MAAISNIKVTMFMTHGTVGWSESHFYSAGSETNPNDPNAVTAAEKLAAARATLLDGNYASITKVRLSVDNIYRDSFILKSVPGLASDFPNAYFKGGYSGTNSAFRSPHISWPIVLTYNNYLGRAICYIAGMPDIPTQTGPLPSNNNNASTPASFLANYARLLVSGVWGTSVRTYPNAGVQVSNASYTAPAPGMPAQYTLSIPSLPGPPLVPAGSYIRLSGFKVLTPLKRLKFNGVYQVLVTASSGSTPAMVTIAVPKWVIQPTITTLGLLQWPSQTFAQYADWSLGAETHRKRGRPTSQPHGKASSR